MTENPFRIQNFQDLSSNKKDYTFLFYGASGTGKSYLAAQAHKTLILACDPGAKGGLPEAVLKVNKNSIPFIPVKSYSELLSIAGSMEKIMEDYEVLVIDSISYLYRTIMSDILSKVGREIPRFDEWNLAAQRTRRLIEALGELHKNIIYTALETLNKDEITGRIFGGPSLPGKLSGELPQACDIVLHMTVTQSRTSLSQTKSEIKYIGHSTPDDIWFAKDRTGKLAPSVIVPEENSWSIFNSLFSREQPKGKE